MNSSSLSKRAREVLVGVIREYIAHGDPIGSQTIVRRRGFDVSSATVRAIMAHLEADGYLQHPHTSAGRIPTDRGYRFYVNTLIAQRRRGTARAKDQRVLDRLSGPTSVPELLANVSHELSRKSHQVGFALAPPTAAAPFRQIEFVTMSPTRVLVVVVFEGGQVTQKIVQLEDPITPTELRRGANYLNHEFAGKPLAAVRAAIEERLREDRVRFDRMLAKTLRLVGSTLVTDQAPDQALFIDGASALMQKEAGLGLESLTALVKLIEEKDRLVRVLNEYIDGDGLTIIIGTEHHAEDLRHFSLVASTFSDGVNVGTVGIIGPTRMPYGLAIATVDGVAQTVSDLLSVS